MEYNFLADFLAKFSSFTSIIQGLIVIMAGTTFISCFYFLKQTITHTIEFLIRPLTVKNQIRLLKQYEII